MKTAQFGVVWTTLTGQDLVLCAPTTGDIFKMDIAVFAHAPTGIKQSLDDVEWFGGKFAALDRNP